MRGEQLGTSLPGSDSSHKCLQLDEADEAPVELSCAIVFLTVVLGACAILLHQASLLLQLILRGVRPQVFRSHLSVRVATFAIRGLPVIHV